jgi:hypothetical protein
MTCKNPRRYFDFMQRTPPRGSTRPQANSEELSNLQKLEDSGTVKQREGITLRRVPVPYLITTPQEQEAVLLGSENTGIKKLPAVTLIFLNLVDHSIRPSGRRRLRLSRKGDDISSLITYTIQHRLLDRRKRRYLMRSHQLSES